MMDPYGASLFRPVNLSNGSIHDVIVTYYSGPSEFYVQHFAIKPFLESLTWQMQILYSMVNDNDLCLSYDEIRKESDITQIWCAASVQEKDSYGQPHLSYYRAKLIKRLSPTIFQVCFVDYGDLAELPLSSLRRLPDTFCSKGPLAIRCRLLEPNIEKQALMNRLHPVTCCVLQFVDVDADPYVVKLFLTDGHTSEDVGETLSAQRQALSHPYSAFAGRSTRATSIAASVSKKGLLEDLKSSIKT